ncbi:ATP-grasp domain-containing protein [Candidatus Aminicenantes bacterium AH-873-B07]|jgi:carbamoylphosphate synthase large subunit|nr:ATP-grasp domain-containing protein [Candidatus Aminicenantes bacterium AH-873-B07]
MYSCLQSQRNVLVTGVGGPAGKACVHFLKEKGFYVLGIDMKEIKTEADIFRKVPPALESSYIPCLLSLIKEFNISLLIPTVTEELVFVAQVKDQIEKFGCCVFISSPKITKIANDKFLTAKFLEKRGLPVPKTVLQKDLKSLNSLTEIFEFPILSKPRFGRGGRGVKLYYSEKDLYDEKRKGLVFQEFIPGEEYNPNLFVFPKSNVIVNIILKKTALKNGIVGNALSVKRENNLEILKISKKIGEILKLEGPIDIDIRLKTDGTPIILEVNARVGANVLEASEVLETLIKTWFEISKQ